MNRYNHLIMRLLVVLVYVLFSTVNAALAVDAPQTPTSADESIAAPNTKETSRNASASTIKSPSGRISFNFQNIAIRDLLQLIAKTAGKNIIVNDTVTGNITLSLKDVSWQQALKLILQSHGLGSQQMGDTIFVSTIAEITQNKTKQLQSDKDIETLSPLSSLIIPLKYTDANNMVKVLKSPEGSLLTARGEVVVDTTSNKLIIRDIKSNLSELARYIKKLDIPVKQVSIEARIVSIDTTFESQLGVRFGVSNMSRLSGTLTGANQLAQGIVDSAIPATDRLNFNIPASALSDGTHPASVGLALARLGSVLLDLELSALEQEGRTQVIARPHVITANQQKAIIQEGQEIPYQQSTSSGATSVSFVKAVLSLEITPQITPNNKILLKLKASQDSVGKQYPITAAVTNSTGGVVIPAAVGPPSINTQLVESYIVVNDNETVVVGGIYQLSKQNTFDRVPFFSDLPVVGNLFKYRGIKNDRRELLIFITPKVIHSLAQNSYADNAGYKGAV